MRSLRHPVQALSTTRRRLACASSLVLGFVLWYALIRLDVPLETPVARWGMISLQFAGTAERSQEILDSWNLAARDNAQSGLLLDFLFPLCYSTLLTIGCFWSAGLLRERGYRKSGLLAAIVAWLQWPAAGFDYIENIALWVQVRGTVNDVWARIASTCATFKFLLAGAGLCIWLAAIVVWIFRRRAAAAGAAPIAKMPAS